MIKLLRNTPVQKACFMMKCMRHRTGRKVLGIEMEKLLTVAP